MTKHKQIHCQPIVTDEDVYTLKVFINPRLKKPKFHIVVTDSTDDLIFCESYFTYDLVKTRISEIDWELRLTDKVK